MASRAAVVRRATLACAAASVVWLAAILAAPHGLHAAPGAAARLGAGAVYLAGRAVCHQRPERSFLMAGHPLPARSRRPRQTWTLPCSSPVLPPGC